jgi:tight adherence protein C
MLVGTFVLLFWLFLFFTGKKYASLFDGLNEADWQLKEIYFVGHNLLQRIGYKYNSDRDHKIHDALEILDTPRFADYYLRAVRAQQVTITLTAGVLAFVLFGIVKGDATILPVGLGLVGAAFYYYGDLPLQKMRKRKEKMLSDFSEVVSKVALLVNTGMILRNAWEQVAEAGDGIIYDEMKLSVEQMNNGISEMVAVSNFGKRSQLQEVKKFAALLAQGISKGNRELASMLTEQSAEVWEIKKQLVKRQGEKAASKLMLPMMLMFIGILILVVVPMVMGLQL